MSDTVKETPSAKARDKTDIFLLCGFLGSGKTTLLKRILSWETDLSGTVVLVNEFGEIGIDGALLKGAGSDVLELASGCVCCTLKRELAISLDDIWTRFRPERILLEASGVAEPAAVAEVLEDIDLQQKMQIKKIITVLDIRLWIEREKFGPFFMNQAMQANLILLNKIDTVSESEVSAALEAMNVEIPGCRVVPSHHCTIDSETLWAGKFAKTPGIELAPFFRPERINADDYQQARPTKSLVSIKQGQSAVQNGYVQFSFSANRPLDRKCLEQLLMELPWSLFRIKGPVKFPDGTLLLNYVAGRIDWEDWDGTPETKLVFVGWKVDGKKVLAQLKPCVLPKDVE
jgi:G3E family GTPase